MNVLIETCFRFDTLSLGFNSSPQTWFANNLDNVCMFDESEKKKLQKNNVPEAETDS